VGVFVQALQGLGGGLYLIVGTILGVRLLVRASRQRLLPELLLGIAFLVAGTIGSPLEVVAEASARNPDATWAGSVLAAGKLLTLLGLGAYVGFTWRVFRPGVVWAAALAGGLVALQFLAFVGYGVTGVFSAGRVSSGAFFWVEFAARVAMPIWTTAECLRYSALMRRRQRLDLGDPVVANRFALWATASLGGLLMLCTSVLPRVLGDAHPVIVSGVFYLVFAGGGIVASAGYWLAFFAPGWYRRWLAPAGAVEG